jgi:hypothetical protein
VHLMRLVLAGSDLSVRAADPSPRRVFRETSMISLNHHHTLHLFSPRQSVTSIG